MGFNIRVLMDLVKLRLTIYQIQLALIASANAPPDPRGFGFWPDSSRTRQMRV